MQEFRGRVVRRLIAPAFGLLFAHLFASCACGDGSCPRPCGQALSAERPCEPSSIARPSPVSPESSGPLYEAARKAWADEIEASEKWLADCILAADREGDPSTREQRVAACKAQYLARVKANDALFERRKQDIRAK